MSDSINIRVRSGCLFAIPQQNMDSRRSLYVYWTDVKKFRNGTEYDTPATEEKWILEPTTFTKIGKIGLKHVQMIKEWVYGENSGIDTNCLSMKDRIIYYRLKIKGIEKYLTVHAVV